MVHIILYGPTLGFPFNLLPLDFHSQGILLTIADLQNVIFTTPPGFQAEHFNPKKCVIVNNTKFATKQRKFLKYNNINSKSWQYL